MSEISTSTNRAAIERLNELLNYVNHLEKLKQKPIFRVEEYKQLNIWEHELKGKIGIQHNLVDQDGVSVWLKIERLKRLPPPPIKENIQAWVTVGNDPKVTPQVKDKIIKTLPKQDTIKLIENGMVTENDVSNPLKEPVSDIKMKDVIFRLENNQQVKIEIDNYLNKQWWPWSEKEKPRRETIKIYDSLFSLQQTIEAQGDKDPIELVWGIGISRWICEGNTINHPLLEKPIEIEVDRNDGAILIHPRNIEATVAVDAYFALENPGADALLRFSKKHFSELLEDAEFSPYVHKSFEPLLRQASTHLSENGTYWPDVNPNRESREPNKPGESLEVTDSWVIFARPRSTTGFIQDIERFQKKLEEIKNSGIQIPNPTKKLVTELSDEKPLKTGGGFLSGMGGTVSEKKSAPIEKGKTELYFPKAFNESQEQIIDRLEENDGVVVQGPPGTGKTHTIANIICHYLATGRRVLVTSKGEPALSVLQDQIPEKLRSLTISLLANERQGTKQLESTVERLAGLVSQTNLWELQQDAETNKRRVEQINREISKIDKQIKEWGRKQLNPVGKMLTDKNTELTAMELAQLVISNDDGAHDWLQDELQASDKYTPQFNDADIATIRTARRKVGEDIIYAGNHLPNIQDLPDSTNIAAIHYDLSKSANIADELKNSQIPQLAVSVKNSVDRAGQLKKPLQELAEILDDFKDNDWLEKLFHYWVDGSPDSGGNVELFNELIASLSKIAEQRKPFIKTLIEIPDPSTCLEDVKTALENLANNKRAFGFFPFGNRQAKIIIDQTKVDGDSPKVPETWKLVLDYVNYQDDMRKFIIKWNHSGQEFTFPVFEYHYGSSFKEIQSTSQRISKAKKMAEGWYFLSQGISELFPHGIDIHKTIKSKSEMDKVIQAIELNTSKITLGAQRSKLQDLMERLKQADGDITENIKTFVEKIIGKPEYSPDEIIQKWDKLLSELRRINKLHADLQSIEYIAAKVSDSGAPIWAGRLKSEPLLTVEDELSPVDWYKTWQWKQRKQYLHEIDGREQLKELSTRRSTLDNNLKRTFSNLVRLKTNIGLHRSMTERVQGALMRFVSAIAKIGKGTGKRAPRHRRDAHRRDESVVV